jgi:DNA mismatch repair ATPase MutS
MIILEAHTSIKDYKFVYGVAMVDSTTNEFFIDQFYDDEQSNNLRSLLARTRPLEVLVQTGMRPELEKLIK